MDVSFAQIWPRQYDLARLFFPAGAVIFFTTTGKIEIPFFFWEIWLSSKPCPSFLRSIE
jgi:hypothetical protein